MGLAEQLEWFWESEHEEEGPTKEASSPLWYACDAVVEYTAPWDDRPLAGRLGAATEAALLEIAGDAGRYMGSHGDVVAEVEGYLLVEVSLRWRSGPQAAAYGEELREQGTERPSRVSRGTSEEGL